VRTADPNIRGIVAMCFTMAVFMVNDVAVKLASQSLSVGQVVLLRGLLCCAFAAAALTAQGSWGELRALRHPLVILRCGLEGLIAITFIGALSLLPIATVTAIFLSSPLMISVAAALFLGETVRWRRWTAAIVGFLGVLLVLRPGREGLNVGVLLILFSTVLVVARDIITRQLPRDIPTGAVAVGTIVTAAAVGGVLAMLQPWRPVASMHMLPLAVAALAVTLGNYTVIMAFRSGDVSVVSPFRYTLMVWGVLAGLLVFGEFPDETTWLGIALIVGAGLYTLWRETKVGFRAN
jgi:drug/metabolite transporter (DMT)-like permease